MAGSVLYRIGAGTLTLAVMTDTAALSTAGFDLTPPTEAERERLEADLTAEEARVLLHHGTEAPFCGGLLGEKNPGVYCCRLCGLPLFKHETKFESGTGWPSFWDHLPNAIRMSTDYEVGYPRTEVRCRRCAGHLGHVFDDGPRPTGKRYCMNGVAMKFTQEKV